jgi:AcrR family transcriptional regulator
MPSNRRRSTDPKANSDAWKVRRREIVTEAARLFDEHGYAQTSVYAIADAAELQKASLYHYFQSKTDLLVQIHDDYIDILSAKLDSVGRGEVPPDERLRAVVYQIVELMKTNRHFVRVFFEYSRELPAAAQRKVLERRREYRETVIEIIADGIREGIFRDVEPYYATMAVFGMTNWVYQWYESGPGTDPERIADAFWDFLQAALSIDAPPPRLGPKL